MIYSSTFYILAGIEISFDFTQWAELPSKDSLQVQIENKCNEIKVMGRYFCKITFCFYFAQLEEMAKVTKLLNYRTPLYSFYLNYGTPSN